jgi:hypothetical protein
MLGDNLDTLTAAQKENRLRTTATVAAIVRDKIQLLTGQSTSNISLIQQHYKTAEGKKPISVIDVSAHTQALPQSKSDS